MNIGIRLHDTVGSDLKTHLASAKAQGFSCAHIAMSKCIAGFDMAEAPRLLTAELAKETAGLLKENGIQPAVLGCYLNLATPDEEEYAHTAEIYRAHLRFASLIGAEVVGTETGAPNTAYRTEPACYTEESLQLFIRRLRPIVRAAEEYGAVLAIEPVVRHIVATPERAERVLDAIDSPALQIILDAINLLNRSNCAQVGQLTEESFRRFGDRIRILHMKDFLDEGPAEEVRSLACGLGQMDYTALIRFAEAHPGLPMTLEDTVPENAEAARKYLESLV